MPQGITQPAPSGDDGSAPQPPPSSATVAILAIVVLVAAGIGAAVIFSDRPAAAPGDREPTTVPTTTAAERVAYLDKAEPLMTTFWQSVDRAVAADDDVSSLRPEAQIWYDVYMAFYELKPPPEYEEYHRLTLNGLSIMAWAGQDIRKGDLAAATPKIANATDLFNEADALLRSD